jgi:hypothetical protein
VLASVNNECMEYAKNSSIPVRVAVTTILMCKEHDISIGPGIKGILITVQVVSCVIDPENLVAKYFFTDEYDHAALSRCEFSLVSIIF